MQQPLKLPAPSPLLERTRLASSSTFPAIAAVIYTSQRLSLLLGAVHVLTCEVAEDEPLLPSPLAKVRLSALLPFDQGLSLIDKGR